MSDEDQTTNDLTQPPQASYLESQTTMNIHDQSKKSSDHIDELICKEDDSEEEGFILESMARFAQRERDNLEAVIPKFDSSQEFSDQLHGGLKSFATQHQTTKLQITKKMDFAKIYGGGDLYGSEEGEDSGNKGLAKMDTVEEQELTLTGYCGDIEEETEKESKDDDSDDEGFLGAENTEESDPQFKELLQSLESDKETTESEQEKVSEEAFVATKKTLLERIAYSSSNDIEQEEGSDGDGNILTNMEGLEELMRSFNLESGYNDESYQLKNGEGHLKLMDEADKDQHRQKKSLMKWLSGYVELDEDWETVREIKDEVVKLAVELSHMLVNLMFSLPKIELVDKMFQGFFNSLKYQCADENSKVIHMILVLLESADEEGKRLKKLEVDTLEEKSDTDQDDEFRGSELRERLFEGSHVDELITKFFSPIMCLENILVREGEPDPEILVKDLLSALKDELKECQTELKRIASKIDELKAEYRCILRPDDLSIYEMMKLKINELWNKGLESEEDKDN